MDAIKYAQEVLGIKLTYVQQDLLELLQKDDSWVQRVKPKSRDTKVVLDVYHKYKAHCEHFVTV
ncbi:hypothetical protein [Paenibacillus xylaniclasticus]|uniref:hypothetical protein n=1 Tax=Paenibacillus xylaniclasticus TaxID=588083 RepID=UPI000FDCD2C7|nr:MULTISPECIES: hypothetical protein [Paenibacillus]GFN32530.1 hypothetical protein PCURB6_27900 [Paenibacillus curdlanolyticus]